MYKSYVSLDFDFSVHISYFWFLAQEWWLIYSQESSPLPRPEFKRGWASWQHGSVVFPQIPGLNSFLGIKLKTIYKLWSYEFQVLADYMALTGRELNLQEGEAVELIKIGCAGWWWEYWWCWWSPWWYWWAVFWWGWWDWWWRWCWSAHQSQLCGMELRDNFVLVFYCDYFGVEMSVYCLLSGMSDCQCIRSQRAGLHQPIWRNCQFGIRPWIGASQTKDWFWYNNLGRC